MKVGDLNCRVFITNLGKYNEGHFVLDIGKWISLPISEEDLKEELKSIGVEDNSNYEEYSITDWECPTELESKFAMYVNLNHLSELIEELESFEEDQYEVFIAINNDNNEQYALDTARKGDFIVYRGPKDEIAKEYLYEMNNVDSHMQNLLDDYFDFDEYFENAFDDVYESEINSDTWIRVFD